MSFVDIINSPTTDHTPAPEPPLEILYRDDRYIAIHKPSGLLVHRSPIDKRETRFAIQLLRDQIGQHVYPAHRIDRPTSGILLFGLDDEAGTALSILFQERKVQKTYQAVVRGHIPTSGTIDSPLHKYEDLDGHKKSAETQDAHTDFKRLAISELPYPTERYATSRFSLVELFPHTGRRHQIRRHLAHIRYPIVGDVRHGCNKTNKLARENLDIHRLLLAATQVEFQHPFQDKLVQITCQPEDSFLSALSRTELATT
ncbi:pseudouridine synthase [Pelagicoccus mobilis]|uniref:tRNA pseudouridine synthase C n=1 Tax=Pelagicoccus mobilis TaxID=415221 RepID=A0A934S0K7_9BACT|nr:pseudouridine synthase [Pelagicoccus mobilis]MBK1876903.1 tRNA pseudouridine(65) synthase TruC [Pelagicoccus mobilis]